MCLGHEEPNDNTCLRYIATQAQEKGFQVDPQGQVLDINPKNKKQDNK